MFSTILDHGLLLLALMVGDPGGTHAPLALSTAAPFRTDTW